MKTALRVVNTFEQATLPDRGEALADEIDEALDSFGLDDHVRNSMDDLEDEMPDLDDDLGHDAVDDAGEAQRNGAVDKEAPEQ